ncbi:hypothetical protein A3C23_04580 [Candidatus Roizmanbacteria bacterium RIFCSPHIGHO2_02_FULL_37_13b]|uniref:Hydrolase TatD n=1 Tax=Candidatus Roizmanbacteria bacterium RIFCSPLOWO2_02_FULL_36_11 TaxID=1802071 RepID=A0A1F7JHA1_9BACT|nr:MAG: hypothetical protein A3C23_04580 [Candidatus Roizmanbacteria bacterium RIFCSPHIGHO2_02_FULL_37_13b]OGK54984.1 MAG: hypothetical protein A3H78_00725 [Candidatus Roizmanbacteria bacterium RIFCSPLOWO2_02_FULL_36_11]
MFDTHCHLNFKAFDGIVNTVISAARAVGVNNIVIPGTDVVSSKKALLIAEKYDNIYAAVGIHPHHVFDMVKLKTQSSNLKELDEIESLLRNDKVVAVGEVGLDRHIYQKTKYNEYQVNEDFMKLQEQFLIVQLKLAYEFKKSVIIHNREAKDDLLQLMTENWDPYFEGKIVFHCCEPDDILLDFAIKHNIYIGVDGDVTYSPKKAAFVKKIPSELLVLETDSPFLLPRLPAPEAAGNGGQAEPLRFPNIPKNLNIIAEFVAKSRGESVENLQRQTTENAKKLFNLT